MIPADRRAASARRPSTRLSASTVTSPGETCTPAFARAGELRQELVGAVHRRAPELGPGAPSRGACRAWTRPGERSDTVAPPPSKSRYQRAHERELVGRGLGVAAPALDEAERLAVLHPVGRQRPPLLGQARLLRVDDGALDAHEPERRLRLEDPDLLGRGQATLRGGRRERELVGGPLVARAERDGSKRPGRTCTRSVPSGSKRAGSALSSASGTKCGGSTRAEALLAHRARRPGGRGASRGGAARRPSPCGVPRARAAARRPRRRPGSRGARGARGRRAPGRRRARRRGGARRRRPASGRSPRAEGAARRSGRASRARPARRARRAAGRRRARRRRERASRRASRPRARPRRRPADRSPRRGRRRAGGRTCRRRRRRRAGGGRAMRTRRRASRRARAVTRRAVLAERPTDPRPERLGDVLGREPLRGRGGAERRAQEERGEADELADRRGQKSSSLTRHRAASRALFTWR